MTDRRTETSNGFTSSTRSPVPPESDGRTARRDRNLTAVLDAAIGLFADGIIQPSPGEIATRSGISHRSINRYFPDMRLLIRAAVDRQIEIGIKIYRLHAIGSGPLDQRIDNFVRVRLHGHEVLGPTARAAGLLSSSNRAVRSELAAMRVLMTDQVSRQFAPEFEALPDDREAASRMAIDALFQFESLEYYLKHRELDPKEARVLLVRTVSDLLDARTGGHLPS